MASIVRVMQVETNKGFVAAAAVVARKARPVVATYCDTQYAVTQMPKFVAIRFVDRIKL